MDTGGRFTTWVCRHSTLAILIIPFLIFAALVAQFGGTILESVAVVLFINLMLVAGLQMFMGNSGVSSFGHIGFMAIAAYISAILTLTVQKKDIAMPELYPVLAQIHWPFMPSLLVAAAVATLVAAVIIYPLMRLSGPAAAISTFALLIISNSVITHWEKLTNGMRAIYGLERYTTVWTSAIFGLLSIVAAYWFKETRVGLKLRASREDERAAASIGINVTRARYVAFVSSIFVTAIAGVLWAHFVLSFSPKSFYLVQTFMVVAMLIIGGSGSVSGAVVGTVVVTVILEGLRYVENSINLAGTFPFTIIGIPVLALCVAMILILILRPGGIMAGREIRVPCKWGRPEPAALEPPEQKG
jgi:branched-chain amino acid transport system permease protein